MPKVRTKDTGWQEDVMTWFWIAGVLAFSLALSAKGFGKKVYGVLLPILIFKGGAGSGRHCAFMQFSLAMPGPQQTLISCKDKDLAGNQGWLWAVHGRLRYMAPWARCQIAIGRLSSSPRGTQLTAEREVWQVPQHTAWGGRIRALCLIYAYKNLK